MHTRNTAAIIGVGIRAGLGVMAVALGASCYSGAVAQEASEGGESTGSEDATGSSSGEAGESSGGESGSESEGRMLEAGNQPPEIVDPGPQSVAEDESLALALTVHDPDGDPLRVWALGLPPGASWDEPARVLRFRPDFIQGGRQWTVTIVADDGAHRSVREVEVEAIDSIRPPEPEILGVEELAGFTRITLSQITDDYLASPGNAGQEFAAFVMVPAFTDEAERFPVRIGLHGIGTATPPSSGSASEFRIGPHDPDNTYWWGYDAGLPDADPLGVDVPDYTQRRVMHLLGWVLESYPQADAGRVYVAGSSMGGAGAMTLGLWYARHFAYLSAQLGQSVPRNHRPSRVAQLEGLWGPSDAPVWDSLDLTWVLATSAEAREQYMFVRHGKDDPTIHFGAAVRASPRTGERFYDALQGLAVGHLAVWDEGAHGPADPKLGAGWWDESFSPIYDETSFLRSDLAFPAFSLSSADGDPGDGGGNGKQSWDVNAGYAGVLAVAGDTGWNGEIAGALNRFLRWDATAIVDTLDRFAVPLHVHDGDGDAAPAAGYPSRGDRFDGELPVVVDVTPRRAQAFRLRPGELVAWRFGGQSGEASASATGELTIPGLELGLDWQLLELRRVAILVR